MNKLFGFLLHMVNISALCVIQCVDIKHSSISESMVVSSVPDALKEGCTGVAVRSFADLRLLISCVEQAMLE